MAKTTQRKTVIGVLVFACLVFLAIAMVNRHVETQYQGFAQHLPVYDFQIALGEYYLVHDQPPPKLSVLVPAAEERNSIVFSTPPGWKCSLDYTSEASKKGGAVAHFRCGDPVLYEVWYGADGDTLRDRRYPRSWWRVLRQRPWHSELYVRVPEPPPR